MNTKNLILNLSCALLTSSALLADEAKASRKMAKATKIAFAGVETIMEQSEEYKDEMMVLQQEAEKKQKRMLDLEQKYKKLMDKLRQGGEDMTSEARSNIEIEMTTIRKQLEVEERRVNQEMGGKLQDLQKRLYDKIMKAKEDVRTEGGWDAIQPKFGETNPDFDVTEEVVLRLNSNYKRDKVGSEKTSAKKLAQEREAAKAA